MKEKKRLSRATLVVILAGSALLALRAFASFRAAGHAVIGGGSGGPLCVLERTEEDLGLVGAGEVLSVRFPVHNRGSQRLVLTPGDCFSCAQQAGLEPVMIPPGGSGEVVVTLRTGDTAGDVREVASYSTSDPRQPQVEFVVTGNIE